MSPSKIVAASLATSLKPIGLFALVVLLGLSWGEGAAARPAAPSSEPFAAIPLPAVPPVKALAAARPRPLADRAAVPAAAVVVGMRAFAPADLPMSAFGDTDDAPH